MSRPEEVREYREVGEMPTEAEIEKSHGSFWLRMELSHLTQLLGSLEESSRDAEARGEKSLVLRFDKRRNGGGFAIYVAEPVAN